MSKSPYDILVRPLITERALAQEDQNKYIFQVALNANKTEIREAIETAFGVRVVSVNTVLTKGKNVVRMRTPSGRKRDVKKAIVKLAEGQKLEIG